MLGCDSAMAGAATAPTATPAAACLRNDLRFIKALLSLFWFAWQSICPRNLSRFASREQAGGSRVVHPPQAKSATLLSAADRFARLVVRPKVTEETCS